MRAFSPPTRFAVLLLIFVSFSFTLLLFFISGFRPSEQGSRGSSGDDNSRYTFSSAPHRKLLLLLTDHPSASMGREEPNRMWGDKCSKGDIVINQGPTAPLPSGIPSYTVEIMNVCVTGCDISRIHVNCGWFSSARLINPKIFKRLRYNDCLVNDGKPMVNGGTLSFEYANTFLYPLKVSSVVC